MWSLGACDGAGATATATAVDAAAIAVPDATPVLGPDIVLYAEHTLSSLEYTYGFFYDDSCAVVEGCVDAPGQRMLLRFGTTLLNRGDADLIVGRPRPGSAEWQYSECHDHYHYANVAAYELVGPGGVVASGRKQAFCLMDVERIVPGSASQDYDCRFQGISAGWADVYPAALDCQWIDVTDVPPGEYTLRIRVNAGRVLDEADYDNNVWETPVAIP